MNKHERYNKSEKGHQRYLRYYHKNSAEVTYAHRRREFRARIITKQLKIAELERMLNNVQEV